ncbi:DNA mismatch repair protein MutS, partial [Patescibacteria group bacterium]|nr:DNA mismatch repair protein MutS [Patescibacteria group bacterium]
VKELKSEMLRLDLSECICGEELIERLGAVFRAISKMVVFPYEYFKNAEEELKKHFGVGSLTGFGLEGKDLAVLACGVLLEYLRETQKSDMAHIKGIANYELTDFMPLDESLIRNLELFYTAREAKKEGSLIWVLDQTVSSMGGRKLRNWLIHPLVNKEQIEDRWNKLAVFTKDTAGLNSFREVLANVYDLERLISKLSVGSGNARDLKAVQKTLEQLPKIKASISGKVELEELKTELKELGELRALIEKAIMDEAPLSVRDGGMIADGYDSRLDELRVIMRDGKSFIRDLQEREVKRTGVSSLKVKFNKVFGYYIEMSKSNLGAVPEDYIRKQTLVNAERFITPELKEYEEKVLSAEDKVKELEYELFYSVKMEVLKEIVALQKIAKAIAELDVLSCFAYLALKNNYVRPEICEDFEIVEGRHPVIEKLSFSGDFVPNDCMMNDDSNFLLITGPNMGGKSTYLRQVALISLMAQIGSFVPAKRARISVVDRIFTRVGASDNLSKGESTFMVEMQEAAYILNQATSKSLVILDEIGRGTSTYDGVSIAWAITEFIHDNISSKTLFATHYHELIELADKLPRAKNLSVSVRENEKEGVVFLYKIAEGGVDKSYGIEVAKLAGLPVDVIGRARGVLDQLENKKIAKSKVSAGQIGMFEEKSADDRGHKKIVDELKGLDLNNLTPLQAMSKLQEIKDKSDGKR